jgi:hypothetical protein
MLRNIVGDAAYARHALKMRPPGSLERLKFGIFSQNNARKTLACIRLLTSIRLNAAILRGQKPAQGKLSMNRYAACLISLVPLMAGTAAAETPPPDKATRTFDIVREGKKIGTDIIEIEKQGDVTNVKSTTHISVVIVIEVYHYDHMSVETWKGNQFVSFKSQTDDNGKKHTLAVTVAGDKVQIEADGAKHAEAKSMLPATFWNKPALGAQQFFDESIGKPMSVKIADMGDESISVHSAKIQAHHYRVSGDLERDLWFDGDKLVRLRLLGTDGSKIVSDLRP